MKKVLILLLLCASVFNINGQDKKIIILHTNDLHSHVAGFGPELLYTPLSANDDKTIGGFSRIAEIIKTEKEKSKGTVLVIDAGDFLMGTLFQCLEKENGFQLRLMKQMGYDITCLGNHEFDFGPEWLAGVIRKSADNGKIPSILIGNVEFSKKDSRDDGLEKLMTDNIIVRKLVMEKDNLKIGLFSIIGKEAVKDSPKAAPVTFDKQISFAKKMVKQLKTEKCDIIICVSHSGIAKTKDGRWGGEDVEIAEKVSGIDLIIGSHSHTKLDQPLFVKGIPIVQAGASGEFVGELSLSYANSKTKVDGYRLISVDDKIEGDKNIDQLISLQKDKINNEVLKPLGMSYNNPVAETGFILEGNETGNFLAGNLGPLEADAIRFYINRHVSNGTDISMVAAGVLRDRIMQGKQTASDIFRVMSLGSGKDGIPGYALSRMYFTGRELKNILEILQVAWKSSPDSYCYYSGLRVQYDPDKGLLKKIMKIDIIHDDGTITNVDFSKKNKSLYSITADTYMLEYIGIIKKMSFGLINVVPKDFSGVKLADLKKAVVDTDDKREGVQEGKEWLALMEYLSSMKDTNGDGIPDIDQAYNVPLKCFIETSTSSGLKKN